MSYHLPKLVLGEKNSELGSLFLLLLCGAAIFLNGCSAPPSRGQMLTFSGPMMGTEYRVSMVVEDVAMSSRIEQQVLAAMQSVDQSMSTYRSDSELSQLNAAPSNMPLDISKPLAVVLHEAQRISRLSDGAFDVTLAQAIDLWGFGPNGSITQKPKEQLLAEIRDSVGYQKLVLGGRSIEKRQSGMSISLSAIAKGYAVDQVANLLEEIGISDYLVNIGGELRASGHKDDGSNWKVGIEKPHILGGIQEIVLLQNKAIATSGDYRNYHVIDGKQYSHTIDPKTLTPVFHRLALVSVIDDSAMTADALATAMMAMGESAALQFADQNGLTVFMIIRDGAEHQYRLEVSDSFRGYLQ
ncbi:MAG: thiamine biosynthesis lipoprotein [Cryomorphaceae bacterium]